MFSVRLWGGGGDQLFFDFPSCMHVSALAAAGIYKFTLNLKNKTAKIPKIAGIYIKNIIFIKKPLKTDFVERVPMSLC